MRGGIAVWAASLALAAQAGTEYVLRVGERTYSASDGEPVTIVTPRGEKVALTVSQPTTRTFEHAGFRFDYPAGMIKEESTPAAEAHQVSVETENSTLFMAQMYDAGVPGADVMQNFMGSIREQATLMSGMKPEESVARREIAGKVMEGRKLAWKVMNLENTTEIYVFADESPTTILLIFQADQEDRAEAETCFQVIAASVNYTAPANSPSATKQP